MYLYIHLSVLKIGSKIDCSHGQREITQFKYFLNVFHKHFDINNLESLCTKYMDKKKIFY